MWQLEFPTEASHPSFSVGTVYCISPTNYKFVISLFEQNAWFLLKAGKKFFIFYTASSPSLGPNEPLLRCVPKILSPGTEDDQSVPSTAEVTNKWSYNSIPPIHIHKLNFSRRCSNKRQVCISTQYFDSNTERYESHYKHSALHYIQMQH